MVPRDLIDPAMGRKFVGSDGDAPTIEKAA